MIYDAVQLFTTTIFSLSKEFEISEKPTPCNSSYSWKHGFTLINHMKMVVSIESCVENLHNIAIKIRPGVDIDINSMSRKTLKDLREKLSLTKKDSEPTSS